MARKRPNQWRRRDDGAIEVLLTRDRVAIIDEADMDLVLAYRWCAAPRRTLWYTKAIGADGKRTTMHQLLINVPIGMTIDHANGNGLDNRRSNLRLATYSQNQANRGKHARRATSHFKGVSFCPRTKRWRARIESAHEGVWLGRFPTEREAALAYNEAARQLFGEFAVLNDVE